MAQADTTLPAELQQILSTFPEELVNMRVEVGKGAPAQGWNLFSWGAPASDQGPPAYMPGDHSLFESIDVATKQRIVLSAAQESAQLDRAIGSVLGMGVGDWVGHPMEFVDIQRVQAPVDRRPHFVLSEFTWYNEKNAFHLERGQWTDDASMGLCMADSLIVKNAYDGSDMRTRFWNWWNKGYNNAFRKSADRSGSVGLGGNISKSLYSLELGKVPTPRFQSQGEDSGNGSLMRLAPVPVFFCHDLEAAKNFARESSFTTHPGNIAAEACAFMTFIIVRAIHSPANPADDVRGFLDACAAEYDEEMKVALAELEQNAEANESRIVARQKIRQLIASQEEETSTEYNWNWRSDTFGDCILRGCQNRGRKYNGYPVSPGYWGAYCMDGLAMALNAVYFSTSFATAVERCVNFLGDADSTGSICGQIAGAIYGFRNLWENEPDKQMVERLADWDEYEFGLRGVLLFKMGANVAASLTTPDDDDITVADAVATDDDTTIVDGE